MRDKRYPAKKLPYFGEFLLRHWRCWAIRLGYRHCRVFVDLTDDVHAGVMEW